MNMFLIIDKKEIAKRMQSLDNYIKYYLTDKKNVMLSRYIVNIGMICFTACKQQHTKPH